MKLISLTVLPLWAWILSLTFQGTSGQSSLKTFSPDLQFDNYTLILKGQRIFLHSGEFHTFRLPVPSLWPDILDKFKAAGFNAISVYVHMGLVNPSPGVMDFDGYRSLSALYEAARLAGLWIVLRPGPVRFLLPVLYSINETLVIKSELRTTAADWNAAWTPYIQAIIGQTNQSQISNGGPVIAIQIDIEYDQEEGGPYFAEIEALYRDPSSGIEVPLTHNDPGMLDAFINGTGAVDLYGMDAYPQGLVASNLSIWNPIEMGYHTYHEEANPSQPWYSPEFQSGAFDGWGPDATGYEDWRAVTDADFVSVFYLHTWASNAKLVNYYMLYGGTSWGALPYPDSPNEYSLQITEARTLTRKYTELKLQGIFLRSSPEFYKTDWIGTSSGNLTEGAIIPSSLPTSPAFVTLLRNLDTGAGFWIVRQNDSTSLASSSFKLNVTTAGNQKLTIPIVASSINLDGRESKVIATDYAFGSRSRTLYSTALIFFSGSIDGIDVLFLYGDSDQEHEVALNLTGSANRTVQDHTHVQITSDGIPSTTIITVKSGFQGFIPLYESDTQLILFADKDTVSDFWAPTVASDNLTDPFAKYWSIGTNETVLVGGPYLVRSAVISGTELALKGDLNATNTEHMPLTVIASSTIKSLTWNGENVSLELTTNESMIRTGKLSSTKISIQVPDLEALEWKFNNSLPEVHTNFDDSNWAIANHTTTNIPFPMYYGDGRILYGCDYGFCENVVLWRGHFNASGSEKSVNLSINGGAAFAASVWLNDRFLNTSFVKQVHSTI
ncbi:glycoside hydrolase superfamily [Lentinula edodes]|nr:glycoside hydrolase superfamily [Lentinula edodes]